MVASAQSGIEDKAGKPGASTGKGDGAAAQGEGGQSSPDAVKARAQLALSQEAHGGAEHPQGQDSSEHGFFDWTSHALSDVFQSFSNAKPLSGQADQTSKLSCDAEMKAFGFPSFSDVSTFFNFASASSPPDGATLKQAADATPAAGSIDNAIRDADATWRQGFPDGDARTRRLLSTARTDIDAPRDDAGNLKSIEVVLGGEPGKKVSQSFDAKDWEQKEHDGTTYVENKQSHEIWSVDKDGKHAFHQYKDAQGRQVKEVFGPNGMDVSEVDGVYHGQLGHRSFDLDKNGDITWHFKHTIASNHANEDATDALKAAIPTDGMRHIDTYKGGVAVLSDGDGSQIIAWPDGRKEVRIKDGTNVQFENGHIYSVQGDKKEEISVRDAAKLLRGLADDDDHLNFHGFRLNARSNSEATTLQNANGSGLSTMSADAGSGTTNVTDDDADGDGKKLTVSAGPLGQETRAYDGTGDLVDPKGQITLFNQGERLGAYQPQAGLELFSADQNGQPQQFFSFNADDSCQLWNNDSVANDGSIFNADGDAIYRSASADGDGDGVVDADDPAYISASAQAANTAAFVSSIASTLSPSVAAGPGSGEQVISQIAAAQQQLDGARAIAASVGSSEPLGQIFMAQADLDNVRDRAVTASTAATLATSQGVSASGLDDVQRLVLGGTRTASGAADEIKKQEQLG